MESSLTLPIRPSTKANGKTRSSMDKARRRGSPALAFTKAHSRKVKRPGRRVTSRMEIFMKAILSMASSTVKASTHLSIQEKCMMANLKIIRWWAKDKCRYLMELSSGFE